MNLQSTITPASRAQEQVPAYVQQLIEEIRAHHGTTSGTENQDDQRLLGLQRLLAQPLRVAYEGVIGLNADDMRLLVNYIDEAIKSSLKEPKQRSRALALLPKVIASTHIFPERLLTKPVPYQHRPRAHGGFGLVYQGVDPTLCVKVIQQVDMNAVANSENNLRHICLVSPFMVNGNLSEYAPHLNQKARLPLLFDVANGLDFLHELGIVHGDLKGQNVLITGQETRLELRIIQKELQAMINSDRGRGSVPVNIDPAHSLVKGDFDLQLNAEPSPEILSSGDQSYGEHAQMTIDHPELKSSTNQVPSERELDNMAMIEFTTSTAADAIDAGSLAPAGSSINAPSSVNVNFGDIDIDSVSSEWVKKGDDWFAISNPREFNVQIMHTLQHESVVCCVRFSADGKYLATGCNRSAHIYDIKTGQRIRLLIHDTSSWKGTAYTRSVQFSPDGKYLATGSEDKKIRIWDIAKTTIRSVLEGHQQEIYSLVFSPDGRFLFSGSGDNTVRIWDIVDGTSKVLTINDHDSLDDDTGVTSVAISPNGQFVAAGMLDTAVRIWDVQSGTLVERLRGHGDSVYSITFTPDGKGLVSGSLDKTLKYWDISNFLALEKMAKEGKSDDKGSPCTMNFTGHRDFVLSVAVSHDGRWIASGSKDRGVHFWDAKNLNAVVQCFLGGHANSVTSVDLSPTGNILATGSGDWRVRIWTYSST
ncbi:hypothetical protein NP233_g12369 [Leucocoprinus birnbaumii]|uniref:Serine-threonine/tyrosine-protein kinase catalytic domain-containing protein n=1 Tax=Leucocoprinus birnbaumii TaxID=56174 RepID=A0AAD5VES3_9AGAR|nr:hypothetical protein NP233_g12369 [Leucocoprinus birnbaumii]